IDCADDPGLALNALRAGAPAIRVLHTAPAFDRLADIARQHGAAIETTPDVRDDRDLDLADAPDAFSACCAWLRRTASPLTLPTAHGSCI
ncbi:MAG: hypothetical protein IPK66_17220, partial [Rhodospirillales bacterium]|nr:hypothetical protein [Rhodospirillales bacterium]